MTRSSTPESGKPFAGRYILGEVLGSGGMGIVYSATQITLGRRVAIKVPHAKLATDPLVMRRFRTEAIAGSRLDHHNLVRVLELGDSDGVPFLVMEYAPGTPLDKLVSEHGPTSVAVAVELCQQILAALGAAHGAGVIHADIKCGNVLVETMPGGALHARVIDFGLARLDAVGEDNQMISGTPDYLAPELIQGSPATVSSDLYSVGVILYELMTGNTPFGGGSCNDILSRHMDDAVVPPSLRCPEQRIGVALDAVVMRALRKAPGDRFATAADFAAALRRAPAPSTTAIRARGTEPALVKTDAPTRDWTLDKRPAVVSDIVVDAHPLMAITSIRRAFHDALATGTGDTVVTSYLELVKKMIEGSQHATAAAELERGLADLRAASTVAPLGTWRLQLCLAALYSGLRDPLRARSAAHQGRIDATRARSAVGQARADTLLARLGRPSTSTRV